MLHMLIISDYLKIWITLRDCLLISLPHRLSWTYPFITCNRSWAAQPDDGRCFGQHKEALMLPVKPCLSACRWCSEPEHHGSINVWPQIHLFVVVLWVERQSCWTTGLPLWTLSAAVGMYANAVPWESREGIAPRIVWMWNRGWLAERHFECSQILCYCCNNVYLCKHFQKLYWNSGISFVLVSLLAQDWQGVWANIKSCTRTRRYLLIKVNVLRSLIYLNKLVFYVVLSALNRDRKTSLLPSGVFKASQC